MKLENWHSLTSRFTEETREPRNKPHKCSQLIPDKRTKAIQRHIDFSTNVIGTTEHPHAQKWILTQISHTLYIPYKN